MGPAAENTSGDGVELGDGDDRDGIDEIDVGGSLLPRRLAQRLARRLPAARMRRLTGLATVAVAVVVAGAGLDAVVTRPDVTAGVPSAGPVPPATPTPFERVLGLVQQKQLTGNIRQASEAHPCATVTPGHSPEQAVLDVLSGQLLLHPTHVQSARTLDQYTGLCALQLRAEEPGGVQLVVLVSAPPGRPDLRTLDAVEVGLENIGAQSVEYVIEAEHTGWQVLIGAVGPPGALPRTSDMARAASEPQMQW